MRPSGARLTSANGRNALHERGSGRRAAQDTGGAAELEAAGARIAAKVMTLDERRRLETVHRDCLAVVRAGDPLAYHEANQRFHNAIYECCSDPLAPPGACGVCAERQADQAGATATAE
jgi:hypothetical protein